MSNEALSAISKSDIRPSGRKYVMTALADYADEAWSCFPSIKLIARYTAQSERTVQNHLDALEAAGVISRFRPRKDDGTLAGYRYTIHRQNLPVAESTTGKKQQKPPAESAGHNPHSNPQSNSSLRDEGARELFSVLWEIFPRRHLGQGRKSALKAFLGLNDTDQVACLDGAKAYAAAFERERIARNETLERARRFVPALARWISEAGWQGVQNEQPTASPGISIVEPGTADFDAVTGHMPNPPRPGSSGKLTVRTADLEAARQAASGNQPPRAPAHARPPLDIAGAA
ncbi:helix-turn-helix domain-containing protein [Devosia sp.]|uniref:helix-turn-helix domain-containing protein n=1 Tax=Devosia sp. TaxID=1871048 RepID=UPI001AD5E92C|nr:helix-turn-helix domain-containing protein [Devosia sp.]MBN9335290.1 helix-turn-helix domain-containing protein [Devosia sp.]